MSPLPDFESLPRQGTVDALTSGMTHHAGETYQVWNPARGLWAPAGVGLGPTPVTTSTLHAASRAHTAARPQMACSAPRAPPTGGPCNHGSTVPLLSCVLARKLLSCDSVLVN